MNKLSWVTRKPVNTCLPTTETGGSLVVVGKVVVGRMVVGGLVVGKVVVESMVVGGLVTESKRCVGEI